MLTETCAPCLLAFKLPVFLLADVRLSLENDVVCLCRSFCLSPVELSKIVKPRTFPKGLVAKDQIIFEYDPKTLRNETNPVGVGKSFGIVVDPYGASLSVLFYEKNKKKKKR